ncbi:transmembrane protein 245-like isoform X2 [Ruditapes philippinarum]|uniref:transmembrane protein 245-like isoform X2 n=1 Tax=Ruditapes philippinarum TaxID=129788 RepID=UPI00295A754D|nr:transmembrane protein 245-like isoform X2 [Ruditapes philippinarum]
MASTPFAETRSPLTILNNLPKEHEKAIKQAFYNTAANIFVLLACATTVAVYFILESFLKPLLWAVLCGAFLYPFKRSLTSALRNWLTSLHKSETPFLVGLAVTPIKCADSAIDCLCTGLYQKRKLVLGILLSTQAVYLLWHFAPLWTTFWILQRFFVHIYDLLGYFSTFWVWTVFVAYFVAIIFLWTPESRGLLKKISIPVWLMFILHVAATAGILRVPLLIFMGAVMIVGFVADHNEMKRLQEEGQDPSRKSMFESAMSMLIGDTTPPESHDKIDQPEEETEGDKPIPVIENIGTPMKPEMKAKGDVTKPSSLNVHQEVLRRPKQGSKLTSAPSEKESATRSLSDQYFIGLLWGLVLTRVWIHFWLVCILLPIPMGLWIVKKASISLGSSEGPLGDKMRCIRKGIADWIRDRRDVIMPNWLRGIARIVMKGDQKIIMLLESSLDKATSVLFILLLLVGSTMFAIFFAIQVQQESMYLVKTTSNLLNNSLHPEMASWLPNNEDVQEAMDSMVGNAYLYGRNYIAAKVRDMVNGPTDNNTQIEGQVLDMWDRLYESWLARNQNTSSSTSLSKSGQMKLPLDITNLSSIWGVVTQGDGFNFGDIIAFVKENIGTFLSVLESVWLVLKGNMNLVFTVLTSTLSLVFGGGTALLNFVLSSVIFLTTLFYLLASSGDQYKPIEWFSAMSPTAGTGGNTFGQAVQDAVSGVFMASLKMAVFYGLYTWLTHSLFGVNIVFIPSALAAVFGAMPFLGTYLACFPAVLELWLVKDQFILAMVFLVIHFLPAYVVDTAIYSEIKGGHPYMTGLAIAGGMLWLGLEGAIFGPIILCCLVVLVNVYSTMLKPETPGIHSGIVFREPKREKLSQVPEYDVMP